MKKITYLFLAICLLNACKSDFEDLTVEDWKPILAIPLVHSEITVDEVLTELNHPEEVIILEDGTVALNYKGHLLSFDPENVLEIEDQLFDQSLIIGATEALVLDASSSPVDFPVNVPMEIDLSPSEVKVSEVLILTGSLLIDVTRNQDELVSGELVISELLDENLQPLSISIQGNQPINTGEEFEIDLAGYTLLPTFIPPYTNQMSVSGTLSLENNDANTANAGEFISIGIELSSLNFAHITGDFGNLELSADTDTITMDLFQNIEGGSFALTEAIINIDVTNSFGLPFDIELGEVVSVNQNSGVESQLFLSDISLNGQGVLGGEPEVALFIFDNSNSDITPLFDPAPVDLIFDIEAIANPDGSPAPDDLNFITSESAFNADIDLILPLEGYALNIAVHDTLDMSLSFDQYEELDSLEFKLLTINGFPLDVVFQAYFLDENSVVTDSLFNQMEQIMSAASVNEEGNVVSPTIETTYFTFQNERAENLENIDKVHFRAVFNSEGSQEEEVVRIKDNQTLDIELGVKIFGNAEL